MIAPPPGRIIGKTRYTWSYVCMLDPNSNRTPPPQICKFLEPPRFRGGVGRFRLYRGNFGLFSPRNSPPQPILAAHGPPTQSGIVLW